MTPTETKALNVKYLITVRGEVVSCSTWTREVAGSNPAALTNTHGDTK